MKVAERAAKPVMIEVPLQVGPVAPVGGKLSNKIDHDSHAETLERWVAGVTVALPALGVLLAGYVWWGTAIGWAELSVAAAMYLLTSMGITAGFHRYFTHKSFECVGAFKWYLGVAGSMASQGPILFWAASHRRHHQNSDDENDPHSPHHHGGGVKGVLLGFWHAHIGWMLSHSPENYFKLTPDLLRDRGVVMMSRFYFLWVLLGLAIPAVAVGLIRGDWWGVWTGFLWGGLVRLFLQQHVTWSINSVCHLWGAKDFRTGDESRNNALLSVVSLGESWHNNHHAFPASSRHGLKWWQIDLTYVTLKVASWTGLVSELRTVSEKAMARKTATDVVGEG